MEKINALSWVILIGGLFFTSLIWIGYSYEESDAQRQHFLDYSDFLTLLITDELEQYEQVLVGAKGLFAASQEVELSEWNIFVTSQNIQTRFPGLQGVGYVEHVLHEDLDMLVTKMKNYGIDDYNIQPVGDRDEYYPVLFVEPLDIRNQKAVGYDIYFEQTRKNAVNILKETGDTTITGKITLVQEIDDDLQNGFLMLVPIYSNDANSADTLSGIVYAVFRINDFISGLTNEESFEHHRLKIYDDQILNENLFFDSDEISESTFDNSAFSTEIPVSLNNRNWIFLYEGNQTPLNQIDSLIQIFIPVVGISMSLLLFYVFRIIAKNLNMQRDAINSEKIAAIGTMASRMSHDLKNPLTVIAASLELLQMNLGDKMDEKSKGFIKRIEDSIGLISSIIGDVLEFAKDTKLHKEKASTKTLLEDVISNIDVPQNIQINLPENDITINCDDSKMKSVFSNLITNSIQSIDGKGIITISVEDDSEKTIISIVDSGAGIPSDKINQIFKPMFTTKTTGTGLGLGICKNIIEQHGGIISVHNNPTTFTITLPKHGSLKADVDGPSDDGILKLRKMLKNMLKENPLE